MDITEELKSLQRNRVDGLPFNSLLEFDQWADAVHPLLTFYEPYASEFASAVLGAQITYRMNDFEDAATSMNSAIGILNKAVKRATLEQRQNKNPVVGFEHLLHPMIVQSSMGFYVQGNWREAVLNSIIAIFDLIRSRTGSHEDGDRLINQVMSPNDPVLILSELETDSGQNDQKGFMQIFKGAYQGIRNPKAHTLNHDLNELKAAQYLVLASLLARRIDESKNA